MVIFEAFILSGVLWVIADNIDKKYHTEKSPDWAFFFASLISLVFSLCAVGATFCGIWLLAKDVIGAVL